MHLFIRRHIGKMAIFAAKPYSLKIQKNLFFHFKS
jgi:hypothetical protein